MLSCVRTNLLCGARGPRACSHAPAACPPPRPQAPSDAYVVMAPFYDLQTPKYEPTPNMDRFAVLLDRHIQVRRGARWACSIDTRAGLLCSQKPKQTRRGTWRLFQPVTR
jgi:hypothetical protein